MLRQCLYNYCCCFSANQQLLLTRVSQRESWDWQDKSHLYSTKHLKVLTASFYSLTSLQCKELAEREWHLPLLLCFCQCPIRLLRAALLGTGLLLKALAAPPTICQHTGCRALSTTSPQRCKSLSIWHASCQMTWVRVYLTGYDSILAMPARTP